MFSSLSRFTSRAVFTTLVNNTTMKKNIFEKLLGGQLPLLPPRLLRACLITFCRSIKILQINFTSARISCNNKGKTSTLWLGTKKREQKRLTPLEGDLKTSPIPPPLRSPLFIVVTIHINRLSHAFSRIVVSPSLSVVEGAVDDVSPPGYALLPENNEEMEGVVQFLPSAEHTAVENEKVGK